MPNPFGYIDHTTGSSTRAGSSMRTCATPNVATSLAIGRSAHAGPDAGNAIAAIVRRSPGPPTKTTTSSPSRARPSKLTGRTWRVVSAMRASTLTARDRRPARAEDNRRGAASVLRETDGRLVVHRQPCFAHPSFTGLAAGEVREGHVAGTQHGRADTRGRAAARDDAIAVAFSIGAVDRTAPMGQKTRSPAKAHATA